MKDEELEVSSGKKSDSDSDSSTSEESDSDSDNSSNKNSNKKYQTGLKRETTDAFYTNENIAKKCVEELSNIVDFKEYDIIMEPSAGSGVFSDIFLEYDDLNVLSYDINPKQEYIKKQDFLKLGGKKYK